MGALAACQANAPSSTSNSILMEVSENGLFEVMAELNGEGPYRLVVDTGSELSAIDKRVVSGTDLPVTQDAFSVFGLFSIHNVAGSHDGRVRAGGFESSGKLLVLNMAQQGTSISPDGILGLDALMSNRETHRYIIMDFSAPRLTARPVLEHRMRREITNWTDIETPNPDFPSFLIFDVTIGGVRGKAILDSGLTYSVMNQHFADALEARSRASFMDLVDVNGEVIAPVAIPSKPITAMGLNWDRTRLLVHDAEAFTPLGLDGEPAILMGADLISNILIVVDTRRNHIAALPGPGSGGAVTMRLEYSAGRLN